MEHKDRGFVGKHYLMKQAFGQEELHQREAVYQRRSSGLLGSMPSSSGYTDSLRLCGKRGFCKGSRSDPERYPFSPPSGKGLSRSLQGGLRLVPDRGRDPGEGSGKGLRPVWRKRKRQPFSDPPEK